MRERVLLMGPPGAGKSHQLINVIKYLEDTKKNVFLIDLEDKMEATLGSMKYSPKHLKLYIATSWEELAAGYFDNTKQKHIDAAINTISSSVKPDDWIMIDRVDLAWSMAQRWFTKQKYEEELAERLMEKSKELKKSSMFIPRFDQGSWQVINEQYESFMIKVLYRSSANVILTSGIRASEEGSPLDVYGHIGVAPRGQKELAHQPHSVFLLGQKKVGREISWTITTAKDLPERPYFDHEDLIDFSFQYLANYYKE